MLKNKFLITIFLIFIALSSLGSTVIIYKNKSLFKNFLIKIKKNDLNTNKKINGKEISKNIIDGKYILFFRHTNREKWQDVHTYDTLENNKLLNGEDQEYADAVCLSERGKIHAQSIGTILKGLNVTFSEVISSSSCRARQTAQLIAGRIDEINSNFLFYGPFDENKSDFEKRLIKDLKSLNMIDNKNIFISGHNSTITSNIFDEIKINIDDYSLEEGGFFVIHKKDDKLVLLYKFNNFQEFNNLNVKIKIFKRRIDN